MKKSQRLRFYALAAKQSTGATLTDAELAEFRTLAALASAHPHATEDTDDTEKKDGKKSRGKGEDEDDDEKGEDDEDEDEDADKEKKDEKKEDGKAKGAAARPGVSARLQAAMAGLTGATPATLTAELQKERAEHTQTRADLAAAKASLKSAKTGLNALCDFLGIKPAEIAGKTQADIDAICTGKIGAAATAQVAALGFSPGKLPAPSGKATADSKTMTKAEFDALTPGEKMKFSTNGGRLTE